MIDILSKYSPGYLREATEDVRAVSRPGWNRTPLSWPQSIAATSTYAVMNVFNFIINPQRLKETDR
jgi:hypothetical protein